MTAYELRSWINRLGLSRPAAAEALGVTKRTIDSYLAPTNAHPIPRTVELLCAYIERDRSTEQARSMLAEFVTTLTRTPG